MHVDWLDVAAGTLLLFCFHNGWLALRLSNASLIYGSQTEKGINRDINAVQCWYTISEGNVGGYYVKLPNRY